jgi:hypothetical protein
VRQLRLAELRDGLRRYANPLYHLRKLREDVMATWNAVRNLGHSPKTAEELAESFRGKLLGCFYLAGGLSWIGVAISYHLQLLYKNPFVGQYSEGLINMVLCSAGFQVIWVRINQGLYRGSLRKRFLDLERDLLPVHWTGIRNGLVLDLIARPTVSLIIFIIQRIDPQLALVIPAAIIQVVFGAIFVQTNYMRLIGDFIERWSRVLAERHALSIRPEVGHESA